MISFWEKRSFIDYTYIVVGGGIVGLSTAISIKEKRPKSNVLVLERGVLPSGASTKNAGFACFGSLTELLCDIKNIGTDRTYALVEERWEGLQKLKSRLGEKNIDYKNYGGYELLTPKEAFAIDALPSVNSALSPLFKSDVFTLRKPLIRQFGFNHEFVENLVYNPFEGQIDTGKMMRSLMALAREKEVDVFTGASVLSLEEVSEAVAVLVENIQNMQPIPFRGEFVAVCTNAFTRKLIPGLDLSPGRGQVLVTSPVPGLPFQGVFHFDQGFFYFRNFGERIIFGGGRNIDFEKETTEKFELTDPVMKNLRRILNEIIIPGRDYTITDEWAGIMAFGDKRTPILRKISNRMVVGVRLGGMGVAIGSRLGDQICDLILSG